MFPKLPTHLRPFLGRIPSHTSPDLFTPNPSLLHHLPQSQNGSASHSIVSHSQSSAQQASSGAAGRAGYQGGSAGGSGYTGHARAFTSLQQAAADPSGGFSNNDDTSTQRRKRRESISFRSPYQKTVTVTTIEEPISLSQRLSVHKDRGLRAVDIEQDVVAPGTGSGSGWKQLADSTWSTTAVLDGSIPTQSQSQSPRRGLTRSTSSLELYQVGMPSRPSSLSVRQYSTASPAISELDIDEEYYPTPSGTRTSLPPIQRKLTAPNRVLMDLAGLDIPSRSKSASRGYATQAQTATKTDESVDYTPSDPDNETDKRIYMAIHHAIDTRRKDLVKQLITYYRSPRDLPPPSDLGSHLPLPSGYTVNTYNACIHGLLNTRTDGESIAPVLEIYNEMLERNVVPNGRTYTDVIRALCLREKDVQTAVSRYREEGRWSDFRRKNLGIKSGKLSSGEESSDAIKSYLAEGNLDSAFRLFKGIANVQASTTTTETERDRPNTSERYGGTIGGFYRFYPHVYNYLLDAMATQAKPNTSDAMEVFDHCQSTSTAGRRMLYRHLFRIYAAAGDGPGLEALWDRFEAERQAGEGTKMREWKDILPGVEIEDREVQVEGFQAATWTSAAVSFIQLGMVDKAQEILEMMCERLGAAEKSVALSQPPRPTIETFGQVIIAFAQNGHCELSMKWYERALETMDTRKPLRPVDISLYIDALVIQGQWRLAIDVYTPVLAGQYEDVRPDHTRLKRIYGSLLGDARRSTSKDETLEILSNVSRFMPNHNADPQGTSTSPTSSILLEPELAVQHIQLLLQNSQYDLIPGVLDAFGPMRMRLDREDRIPLHRTMEEIASSPIQLLPLLETLRAFHRQKVQPSTDRPLLVQSILDRYHATKTSSDGIETISQIKADGWSRLFSVVSKLSGSALDEGDYDQVLEAIVLDLKEYAPNTLKEDGEGRLVKALAERLFNRFGSTRATEMLIPLLGGKETNEVLSTFLEIDRSTTPDLVSDGASASASESADTPRTPPPTHQRQRQPKGRSGSRSLVISSDLSKLIDTHVDRNPQITSGAAYIEIRNGIGRNVIPHPGTIGRLMITLARESSPSSNATSGSASASVPATSGFGSASGSGGDNEPKILELYQLAQTFISSETGQSQPAHWRTIEDAMLISQCHLGHLEQAGLHRHRLVSAGTPPSADAYATMIASSKDTTDDATVARELFDESQMMGVRPHLYLYNTVISKLSKARKAEMALEMFAQMKARGVKPSSVTYGAVINACCRVGDAESAETLFQEMSSRPNFKPRVPPYNTMMQFYLQTRPNREKVLQYYTALVHSGVPPSAHTYKLLLDAYHTLPPLDLTSMERTFADLCSDRSVRVQGTHWASLITAYGISAGDVQKALEVFEVIPTHPTTRPSQKPTDEPVVWEAMLNVLATRGTVEQMESMRSRMIQSGVRPTAYVYNVLISGYARHGRIDDARAVFDSMDDTFQGVSAPNNHPTLHTSGGHPKPSSSSSSSAAGTGTGASEAVQVYREPSTYESMIRAEMHVGDFGRAQEVLGRMEERGYPIAVYLKARALVEGSGVGAGTMGDPGVGVGMGGMMVYHPMAQRQAQQESETTTTTTTGA